MSDGSLKENDVYCGIACKLTDIFDLCPFPLHNQLLVVEKLTAYLIIQFSVPQIEYPPGGSSKTGSHVYFLLQDFWEILLFCQIVLLFDRNVVLTSQ